MKNISAEFIKSAVWPPQYPPATMPEIAFVGRSNVGKSSLINTLVGRKNLAKTSNTPGRTQLINFFTINEKFSFVDLPGYGFARAPEEIRDQWEGLLAPYLRHRVPLTGLVLMMDSRHPLTELDVQMIEWFAQTGKPVHVLLSKADKLTRQEQALALREVSSFLEKLGGQCTFQLFSSLKRTGVSEAEAVLGRWLDMTPREVPPPPSGLRTEKVARAKNRKAIGWSARVAKPDAAKKKPPAKRGPGANGPA